MSWEELDADQLRRCVKLGGLEISQARAVKLVALATALLKGCQRLEALDLSAKGGCGALGPWGGVK